MARARGHGEYSTAPLRLGGRHRRPWLRTAQLNAIGWAALLGVCLLAAAAGVVVAAAMGLPHWSGAALAVVPAGAVVLLDRRRWAAMETSFGWGGPPDEVARIAAELTAQGIVVTVCTAGTSEGWGAPAKLGTDEPPMDGASLTYRNGDAGQVMATLRAHGIRQPDAW